MLKSKKDPVKSFEKYPGRFKLSHIKDRKKNVPLSVKDASVVAGEGSIDYPKILKTGQKKWFRILYYLYY